MDLNYSPEDRAFRAETRRWLENNAPRQELKTLDERREWHGQLYARGYIGMRWPREYGGQGAGPMREAIVGDEMARINAPSPINPLGIGIVGPTIIVHGTEAQKRRYLKKILTAEELWCQLYSEPNAGSDLAGLKTSAEGRGDHFVVTGQKIWTSGGMIADWGLLLARTDPAVAKHKGISCFLLSMRQPGVEVRPLRQITGSAEFSEVFMTGARAEKSDLIGNLGQGWAIAQTTLSYERGGNSLARVTRYLGAFGQLVKAARGLRRSGRPLLEDPVVRAKIGRIYAELEVQRYAAL
ncbi:MAG: acyl-CoA dehydrogenase family protein, partial [Candidatus Rokuibacteriota bacterium]